MVYSVTGKGFDATGTKFDKKAIINGYNGKYGPANGNNIKNASIFGRNATSNFNEYNSKELGKKIDINNPPALDYELRYSPVNNPDSDIFKSALMANADEDLGGKPIPVDQVTKSLQKSLKSDQATAEALDFTGSEGKPDGVIDQAENAAYTLLQDACKNQDPKNPEVNPKNIDGKLTKEGHDNSTFVFAKNNVENNRSLLKQIYDRYNLGALMKGNKPDQPAQATAAPDTATKPIDESKAQTPADNNTIKFNLKSGQSLGAIVVQNREKLSKEYGTKELWGKGGLVDQFAKANGFKGFQDKNLGKLKANNDYDFNVSKPKAQTEQPKPVEQKKLEEKA